MLTSGRIEELAVGIDIHLQRLQSFTEELREVRNSLNELRHSQEKGYLWELEKLRAEVAEIRVELQKRGLPEISQYEKQFNQIKETVMSPDWPKAVDPKSICVSDEMAQSRAQRILDLVIGEFLKDKSFLDFGCGEGHVVMQSLMQSPKTTIGYDINLSQCKFQNEHFTSEFDIVTSQGPYDIILLHDVMDHLVGTTPVAVLKSLKSILAPNGKVYLRNHPWCSRHGGHLYTQINKAFLHLIMDEAELSRFGGYTNEHCLKLINPLPAYRQWIKDAGYKICSEVPISKNLEPYFQEHSFAKARLLSRWNGDELAMIEDMQIEFVEYIIEPAHSPIVI